MDKTTGRVIVGASVVGSFTIDENDKVTVNITRDVTLHVNKNTTIVLNDGCSLEEAIRRTSKYGLVVGLNFPPTFDKDDRYFNGGKREITEEMTENGL